MLLPMMLSPPMKSPAQVTCSGHLPDHRLPTSTAKTSAYLPEINHLLICPEAWQMTFGYAASG